MATNAKYRKGLSLPLTETRQEKEAEETSKAGGSYHIKLLANSNMKSLPMSIIFRFYRNEYYMWIQKRFYNSYRLLVHYIFKSNFEQDVIM